MAKTVRPIPEGYHSITPHIVVDNAERALDFYAKAFGATITKKKLTPDGKKVIHGEIKIGDSFMFLSDEFPEMDCKSPKNLGGSPCVISVFTENVDALWKQAVAAGAQVRMPLMDAFWGDRYGKLADPFGHIWALATHKEDLTDEEIDIRAREAFKAMDPSKCTG